MSSFFCASKRAYIPSTNKVADEGYMPRRKNFSGKAKRAELRIKNAEKRGEAAPEDIADWLVGHKLKRQPVHERKSDLILDAGKLESAFLRLSADYRDVTMRLAFATRIDRPVPPARAEYPHDILERDRGGSLTCPVRPRFRQGQSKKEVERNEEGMYRKWLLATRAKVDEYLNPPIEEDEEVDGARSEPIADEEDQWPRSPPWFETNLEVWRQLWRVTELSHIVLLLLDARCPPLHCPTSLKTYLQALKPRKEIILVLTKSDLVDPRAVQAWRTWVKEWWGADAEAPDGQGVQVIAVKSLDTEAMGEIRVKLPGNPAEEKQKQLITALNTAHMRLLDPPAWAREDPEKLARWTPTVRNHVDWTALLRGDVGPAPIQPTSFEQRADANDETPAADEVAGQDQPLTVGLVGQPNVGKSSLLNALLGETKVRASRTPGKTKHFQTMYWGSARHVKIVDCPGLVCPSLAPHELQALAVLPISQIPSLPSCIHFAAERMPLEDIFHLDLPEREKDPYAAKKTWRHPPPSAVTDSPDAGRDSPSASNEVAEPKKDLLVTAGSIMETRALARGYITAKGGRPDTNRAANGIMRMLADGKIRWGIWPSGAAPAADVEGKGIWLASSGHSQDMESDDEPDVVGQLGHTRDAWESEEEEGDDAEYTDTEGEQADSGGDDEEEGHEATTAGRFAALDLDDESKSGSDSEGNDERSMA